MLEHGQVRQRHEDEAAHAGQASGDQRKPDVAQRAGHAAFRLPRVAERVDAVVQRHAHQHRGEDDGHQVDGLKQREAHHQRPHRRRDDGQQQVNEDAHPPECDEQQQARQSQRDVREQANLTLQPLAGFRSELVDRRVAQHQTGAKLLLRGPERRVDGREHRLLARLGQGRRLDLGLKQCIVDAVRSRSAQRAPRHVPGGRAIVVAEGRQQARDEQQRVARQTILIDDGVVGALKLL